MPRNLSAWIDICIHLAVILLLVAEAGDIKG